MQVYVFRGQSGSNKLAYSADVAGRNIPRFATRTEWSFVSVIHHEKIPDGEDVMHHLRQVFER